MQYLTAKTQKQYLEKIILQVEKGASYWYTQVHDKNKGFFFWIRHYSTLKTKWRTYVSNTAEMLPRPKMYFSDWMHVWWIRRPQTNPFSMHADFSL